MTILVPTTPQDMLTLALVDAGVVAQGQTPSSWDIDNAFARLKTEHIPRMMYLRFAQNECVRVPVFSRDVKAVHASNLRHPERRVSKPRDPAMVA